MNILEGYGFVTNIRGIPEIISETDQKSYKNYSSLIVTLREIEPLYRTYQILQTQYNLLCNISKLWAQGNMDGDTIFHLIETQSVLYILANRMFIDNCINFENRFNDRNMQQIIDRTNQTTEEKNLKALRDYASHTSLPISYPQISTNKNYQQKKITYSIAAIIDRNKMISTVRLSGEDKKMIDSWSDGKLEIIHEIIQANKKIVDLMNGLIKIYLKPNVSFELQHQIMNDTELWNKKLIPYHSNGVTYQSETQVQRPYLVDYQLLATSISTIVNSISKE